jgi:hypothetical protein
MLSKPGVIAMPLAVWAIDYWIEAIPARVSIKRLAPWIMLCAPLVILTHNVQQMDHSALTPLWQRPIVAIDALAFYMGKLVCPVHLTTDYGRTPQFVLAHPADLAAVIMPMAIGVLAWSRRRQVPQYWASCLVFGAILLPVLGFVPFYFQFISTVGDRYVYIAMLGPAIAAASLLANVRGRTAAPLCAVAICLLAYTTASQLRVWDNCDTLYRHAILMNPRTALMRYNYGNVLKREGHLDAALQQFSLAITNRPAYPEAYSNAGNVYMAQGRIPKAIDCYVSALRINPDFFAARHNLAIARNMAGFRPR